MKAGSTMAILPRDAFRMSLGHEARSLDKELVAFRARARLMPHSLSQIRALKGLTGPRQSITFPWKLGSKALKRGPQKSFNSESSCCMRAWKFQPSSMTKMSGLSSGNLHQIRRNLEPQMQSPAVLKPRGSLSLTRVSRCPKLKKSRARKSLFQEILSKAWQPKETKPLILKHRLPDAGSSVRLVALPWKRKKRVSSRNLSHAAGKAPHTSFVFEASCLLAVRLQTTSMDEGMEHKKQTRSDHPHHHYPQY